MLFGRLEEFPKYRIYINGDVIREWKSKDKLLKQNLNDDDYYRVGLRDGDKEKKFRIHRLLAMLFLPCNCDFKDITVDHINRIRTDNRLENLRWLDRRGQKLNQDLKDTTTGYPFITKSKSKNTKSGFCFMCKIQRNNKLVLFTGRAKLEDAIELVRKTLIENLFIFDGLPEETTIKIKEKYKI